MTDEEFGSLADDQLDDQLDELSDAEIDRLTQAMLVRAFLGEQFLSQFDRRLTNDELLTPVFLEKAKKNFDLVTGFLASLWQDETVQNRVHRLGDKTLAKRWRELERIIGGGIWRVFLHLVFAKELYEGARQEQDLLNDHRAQRSAVLLRSSIRHGECATVRRTFLVELDRFIDDGREEPMGLRALLPKQKRDSAFRTFVIRYIASELAKYGCRPKIYLILNLMEATLPEEPGGMDVQYVRTALGI